MAQGAGGKAVCAGPFDPVTSGRLRMIRVGARLRLRDTGFPLDMSWTTVSYENSVGVRREGGAR